MAMIDRDGDWLSVRYRIGSRSHRGFAYGRNLRSVELTRQQYNRISQAPLISPNLVGRVEDLIKSNEMRVLALAVSPSQSSPSYEELFSIAMDLFMNTDTSPLADIPGYELRVIHEPNLTPESINGQAMTRLCIDHGADGILSLLGSSNSQYVWIALHSQTGGLLLWATYDVSL